MADEEQLRIIKKGVRVWNAWRRKTRTVSVDLRNAKLRRRQMGDINLEGADLSGADLIETNLGGAILKSANLSKANLTRAYLARADLFRANLNGANLYGASLHQAHLDSATLCKADLRGIELGWASLVGSKLDGADLRNATLSSANLNEASLVTANLSEATLIRADLTEADLNGANFEQTMLGRTILAGLDLKSCKGLEACYHAGPSRIDVYTLQHSGSLPPIFLRGVGLPEKLIDYLPSLLEQSIQFYDCFISYSSKDEDFVRRLHADLQNNGVRCWFAPEDMKIGAQILDTLDLAIRHHDKMLLVLSEASIASEWVEDEINAAFEKERQHGGVVLFPVRIDDAVFETKEASAAKLRRSRNIGDFRAGKDHGAYQKALDRVLRDLRVEAAD
jgi:uncharacterized protein YjbI with pentapeptide repeats